VRLYAPQAFRTQERAVTEADYAAAAERHPRCSERAATRRWTGSWYTMYVTVDRRGGRPVDAGFEDELRGWLERFRLAGYDLEIDGPKYVPLDIALTACVAPGYFRSSVKQALLEALSAGERPGGGRGLFHPDNFTFGQPVYLSQLIAAAMRAPGVQWIDAEEGPGKPNRFQRWGEGSHGEAAEGRIAMGRLEIARLDNDPSAPENGKLEFIMVGWRMSNTDDALDPLRLLRERRARTGIVPSQPSRPAGGGLSDRHARRVPAAHAVPPAGQRIPDGPHAASAPWPA